MTEARGAVAAMMECAVVTGAIFFFFFFFFSCPFVHHQHPPPRLSKCLHIILCILVCVALRAAPLRLLLRPACAHAFVAPVQRSTLLGCACNRTHRPITRILRCSRLQRAFVRW